MSDFEAMNRRAQAQYGAVSGDQQGVDLNMQLMEQQFFFDQSQAAQRAQWEQQHGDMESEPGDFWRVAKTVVVLLVLCWVGKTVIGLL